ncbi:MAG: Glyoxalase/bleomycin resistance protein/dioxygenase [Gemmatimonadetes bacterium]|jgi:glyoxylase I family protein|nr:Glyoxalase/bleomycin resistance protein/dioxygenase [Gemmatimonadota bacterium]
MSAASLATEQGIRFQTSGVHHVALRSTDLARSRVFYIERLGFPVLLEAPGVLIFGAGPSAIVVLGPDEQSPAADAFNPHRVGLDHIALGCGDEGELRRVANSLDAAGIENTGVKRDPTLGKNYVAFKDPDGIAWELYMA